MGGCDNGNLFNDAFTHFGVFDSGRGAREGSTAPGGSGAPMFIGNKVAGVASFSVTLGCFPDVATPANLIGPAGCKLDANFGEIMGHTRVSSFQGWIDAQVPEPSTHALMSTGLAGFCVLPRRRVRRSLSGPPA